MDIVARQYRLQPGHYLGGVALRLPCGIPEVPGLQVHQCLGVQRGGVEVVRVLRHQALHRRSVGKVQRGTILRRIFRVARGQGLNVGALARAGLVGQGPRRLQSLPGHRILCRVHGGVDVGTQHQRRTPPTHGALRVQLKGPQERALRGIVIESIGQHQTLVEPALHIWLVGGDRHLVVPQALEERSSTGAMVGSAEGGGSVTATASGRRSALVTYTSPMIATMLTRARANTAFMAYLPGEWDRAGFSA